MPQIGFTKKQSPVFHRFNALRRAYEDANGGGRIYNPDFLSVLMDGYLLYKEIHDLQEMDRQVEGVSLRAYIADAKANDQGLQPVRIKDRDNRYINNATVATSNFFLTDDRSEAMISDSYEHAKAFLRKCGHEVGNWILEPVNETI